MGGVCWDDPEWRAHEAEQCRRYIEGRKAEAARTAAKAFVRVQQRAILEGCAQRADAREAAGLTMLPISGEAEAKVVRLLREQPAWDRYYREGVGDADPS